jgi:putative transposase
MFLPDCRPRRKLAVRALEQAIARRRPRPGFVHHSDRRLQYAPREWVDVLEKHGAVPGMSRPANPQDNVSCESFVKTLKREEIYANRYDNLEQLRRNIEEFVEEYYNRQRLHSALVTSPSFCTTANERVYITTSSGMGAQGGS